MGSSVSAPPVMVTSFFTRSDAVGFSANDLNEAAPHFYARWSNLTPELLETRLAATEGSEAALCFTIGMVAISALFLNRPASGGHLLCPTPAMQASRNLPTRFCPSAASLSSRTPLEPRGHPFGKILTII
jgi:cystathionine beta-lyase/cystathionine gamma-synthase